MRFRRSVAVLLVSLVALAVISGCAPETKELPEEVVAGYIEKLRAQDDSREDSLWPQSASAVERDSAVQLLSDPAVDVFAPSFESAAPSRPIDGSFDELASVTVVRGPAPSEVTSSPATQYEFGLGKQQGQWWIVYVTELPER